MKSLILIGTLASLLFAGVSPDRAAAQAPADLHILASAGGENSFAENRSIEILANGSVTFVRFIPSDVGANPLEVYTTTLSQGQLDQLWQVIETQNFFGMDAEYRHEGIHDRTYARLVVTANAGTHEVRSANVAVPAFDAIIAAINGMMPMGKVLEYDTTEPPIYFPQDICPFGKQGTDHSWSSTIRKVNLYSEESVFANAVEAHAGTVVAHRISLEEGVRRGIVKLESKGSFFGDAVSIEADNTGNQKTDEVSITLYLEFYGADATEANVTKVKEGIEEHWGNKTTSDGKKVNVNVVTRRNADSTTPPGTSGYHQIKLDRNATVSYVSNFDGFDVNQGTGGGVFETAGMSDEELKKVYAHEAGHLMHLDDRYDDYSKQPDGQWKNEGDGTTMSSADLARELLPKYPGETEASLTSWLDEAGVTRVTPPHDGHQNDLMATLEGTVRQGDIDALAGKANLVVEVRPGDILVNKAGSDQNLAITRKTDLQVPGGEKKRIEGLFAGCIDAEAGVPVLDQRFDVAPHLSQWVGMDAGDYLLQLLEYVDRNDLFCAFDFTSQMAIWRITDNESIGDPLVNNLLTGAGIDLGDRMLDFPRMTNPSPEDTTTGLAVPSQLIRLETSPRGVLTYQPATLSFESVINSPDLGPMVPHYAWSLVTPPGSAATLSDTTAADVSLTLDVRGLYLLTLSMHLVTDGDTVIADPWVARAVYADQWTDTFERSQLSDRFTFAWSTTEAAPWTLTEDEPNSGSKAAVSAEIGDFQTSQMEIRATLPEDGTISFAYRVSSEESYDELVFSIDGVEHGRWSGEIPWSGASFAAAAGEHIYRWAYVKDSGVSEGYDRAWIDDVFFPVNAITVAVENAAGAVPDRYWLEQSHPNPVRGSAIIRYGVPRPGPARIVVFDLVGREVVTVVEGDVPAGVHSAVLETGELASGVYLYRMEAGTFSATRKLVVVR